MKSVIQSTHMRLANLILGTYLMQLLYTEKTIPNGHKRTRMVNKNWRYGSETSTFHLRYILEPHDATLGQDGRVLKDGYIDRQDWFIERYLGECGSRRPSSFLLLGTRFEGACILIDCATLQGLFIFETAFGHGADDVQLKPI